MKVSQSPRVSTDKSQVQYQYNMYSTIPPYEGALRGFPTSVQQPNNSIVEHMPVPAEGVLLTQSLQVCPLQRGPVHFACKERDAKYYCAKILNAIMCFSWKKRRMAIENLRLDLSKMEDRLVKYKNRAEVNSQEYKAYMESNDKLKAELQRKIITLERTDKNLLELKKAKHEILMEKQAIHKDLSATQQELEDANELLSQVSTDLFRERKKHHELQKQSTQKERELQALYERNNELKEEIQLLQYKSKRALQTLVEQITDKDVELAKIQADLESREESVNILTERITAAMAKETQLHVQIDALQLEMQELHACLLKSMCQRVKMMVQWTCSCPFFLYQAANWLCLYLMPGASAGFGGLLLTGNAEIVDAGKPLEISACEPDKVDPIAAIECSKE